MKKLIQIMFVAMFLGVLYATPIVTLLDERETISKVENRKLAEAPVYTRESFLDGSYLNKWETYFSDHIKGRDKMIKGYTTINMKALGRTNVNNIILGKNNYVLPFFDYNAFNDPEYSDANFSKMANQLKALQDKLAGNGHEFYFVGIPSQATYHREDYPFYLQSAIPSAEAIREMMFNKLDVLQVPYMNMEDVFRKEPDKTFYYKTDHHYNFDGAYTTYRTIIDRIRHEGNVTVSPPLTRNELDITTLPNPFNGSRNKQIYGMAPESDQVQYGVPRTKVPYEIWNNHVANNKLYYLPADASTMVDYGVYMGADWAETIIRTGRSDLPNLLIFGDSFTNAIEPLLYMHFNETRILDLRHYKEMGLLDYIDKNQPDVVVMVRDDLHYASFEGNGSFDGQNVKK
jgi:hypothetical protein